MGSYDDDIKKAVDTSEHMRKAGPNNVLWLIVQQLRYIAGLTIGLHVKLDAQQRQLNRIEALLKTPSQTDKSGARITVRGPVEDR